MSQADCVLRGESGELWYSDQYIKSQIENAYMAGLLAGTKIEFCCILPSSHEEIDRRKEDFFRIVNEEYQKRFYGGHVWRVAQKKQIE